MAETCVAIFSRSGFQEGLHERNQPRHRGPGDQHHHRRRFPGRAGCGRNFLFHLAQEGTREGARVCGDPVAPLMDTSYQTFPVTSYQTFPVTSYQTFPVTSYQTFPVTSYQTFPVTSYQLANDNAPQLESFGDFLFCGVNNLERFSLPVRVWIGVSTVLISFMFIVLILVCFLIHWVECKIRRLLRLVRPKRKKNRGRRSEYQ